ncbi:hypothetical protein OIU74_026766 [Salix koriyanagi]|uniref:Uncharacterized protein n=1 Tax=Salix koriyanagi TaxID=2511006 RepID=A0A9Q0VZG8_9ROSI|nr:hypothetical protein OIU74_026766 [Salix koriyanagi]
MELKLNNVVTTSSPSPSLLATTDNKNPQFLAFATPRFPKRAAAKQAYDICRDCRSDNTIPGLGPFGGGIGSAIGGGGDRSGGEPSFGNGDGSGTSDNTIPGLARLYFEHQ